MINKLNQDTCIKIKYGSRKSDRNALVIDWHNANKKEVGMDEEKRETLWDDKYVTGIAVIDWQHKTILSAIENICSTNVFNEIEIKEIFDFIYCYVLDHHSTEELYMKLHGFPEGLIESHKGTHDDIREQFRAARETIVDGSCHEIGLVLKDMIHEHIIDKDMLYVKYLNKFNKTD